VVGTSTSERWVLLLRGINVGGAGRMTMAELWECLSGAGFLAVRTYIQSGNVIVDTPSAIDGAEVRASAATAIGETFGFEPSIHVITSTKLEDVISANPYLEAGNAAPTSVHYFFVHQAPSHHDLEGVAELAASGEEFTLGRSVVYLLAPNGVGRSKLAAILAKQLGGDVTVRNHRSVTKIAALANS
jgi:uncharacterized protein (DUF1697 family)